LGEEPCGKAGSEVSRTLSVIRAHVAAGKIRGSEHGRQELSDDGISLAPVIAGLAHAILVEDYPDYAKGPCALCLQQDENGQPIHVLWGLAANNRNEATLITAYRPDPERWMDDNLTRRPR
jgi:hypothetical protein